VAHPTNTRFALAVHLLTLLAETPGELIDSVVLSVSPDTNPVHVRRVLGRLRSRDLVRSQPGARGGWTLAVPADQIDLGQVWQAVNGDDPVLGLHVPDPDCPIGQVVRSNLHALDRRAAQALVDELAQVTVADVVADVAAGGAGGGATRRVPS
jgi:Rrf2 family protein